MQALYDSRTKGLGHITDSKTDNGFIRIGCLIDSFPEALNNPGLL
jgi:hypothetical protein